MSRWCSNQLSYAPVITLLERIAGSGFYTKGMDLIIWRHADAEDGGPDLERALTPRGREQAARAAKWLLSRLPANFLVVSSPAARARQTALALGVEPRIDSRLAPGASVSAILDIAGWPQPEKTVVVVGHQPDLGQAIAYLLTGHEMDWRLQKGALWWIGSDGGVNVKAVLSPDLL